MTALLEDEVPLRFQDWMPVLAKANAQLRILDKTAELLLLERTNGRFQIALAVLDRVLAQTVQNNPIVIGEGDNAEVWNRASIDISGFKLE